MVTYETYVVKAGDTLSKIAQAMWGDMPRWVKIAAANGITAPYTIRTGQKLLIPVNTIEVPITKGVSASIPIPNTRAPIGAGPGGTGFPKWILYALAIGVVFLLVGGSRKRA